MLPKSSILVRQAIFKEECMSIIQDNKQPREEKVVHGYLRMQNHIGVNKMLIKESAR